MLIVFEWCQYIIFHTLRILLNPETPKLTHIFVDKHHDQLDCPEDQQKAWKELTEWASMIDMQIILLSGSVSPCLEGLLIQSYGLSHTKIAFVRSSTNHSEMGLQFDLPQSFGFMVCLGPSGVCTVFKTQSGRKNVGLVCLMCRGRKNCSKGTLCSLPQQPTFLRPWQHKSIQS